MSTHDTRTLQEQQAEVEYRPVVGHPKYRVGNDGSIWRYCIGLRRCQKYRPARWKRIGSGRHSFGYPLVTLRKDGRCFQKKVHRLVLEAFVGPCPPGMEACHNNGDPADNRLCNLRWDTQEANRADKVAHGTQLRGEQVHFSKLTEGQVRDILIASRQGVTQVSLAKRYGVNKATICMIVNRKCWAHVRVTP